MKTKFNLHPTLQGPTLILRPLLREDFEALFAVASDPLLWEQHPEPTRYQRPVFESFFEKGMESGGAFAVIHQATGQIIGSSRFHGFSAEESKVTVGYTFLARAFWGGPTNRELKKLMLEHAFSVVQKVIFDIGEKNLRSRKAVEKIGGKVIAHESMELAGQPFVRVTYELTRGDFMQRFSLNKL